MVRGARCAALKRTVTKPYLRWVRALVWAAALGGCDSPEAAPPVAPVSTLTTSDAAISASTLTGDAAATPSDVTWTTETDLGAEALRAHVRREGPVLDPRGPGWARVAQVGDRAQWLPRKPGDTSGLAWPEGISTTLYFPVGEEGAALRSGSVFIKGIAAGQRVSLFLDERPVATVGVPMTGRRVTFSLPEGGLAPGEHRLRLWFAFTRFVGKRRTPGGIGAVMFSPSATPEEPPREWIGSRGEGASARPVMFAGAPAAWTFSLWAPPEARFVADTANTGSTAVEFAVWAQRDGAAPERLTAVQVAPGNAAPVVVPLGAYSGQPIRLTLQTTGAPAPLSAAGWVGARIEGVERGTTTLAPVRNLVVWAVDGLRADRVALGRFGEFPATPAMDLLGREGAALTDVWSGGAAPSDGHRSLIEPMPGATTLPALAITRGRFAAYFGTSEGIDPTLTATFTTSQDLRRTGEPDETRVVLREFDDWLDVRKKNPFFVYLSSAEPRRPHATPAPGYQKAYFRRRQFDLPPEDDDAAEAAAERAQRAADYDAQVTAADYWLSQLVAVLERRGVLRQTAIIVVGTVGQDLEAPAHKSDSARLSPDVLRVPAIVWHPDHIATTPRALSSGGSLADLAGLSAELLGAERPSAWRTVPLAHALFDGSPVPLRPAAARLGTQLTGRWGDWWLDTSVRGVVLWNIASQSRPPADVSSTHPITLRLLRDGLVDAGRSPQQNSDVKPR